MDHRHAERDDYGIRRGPSVMQPMPRQNWMRRLLPSEFLPCQSVLQLVRTPHEHLICQNHRWHRGDCTGWHQLVVPIAALPRALRLPDNTCSNASSPMSVSGDVSFTITPTTRSTAELIVSAGTGRFPASPRSAAEASTAAARPCPSNLRHREATEHAEDVHRSTVTGPGVDQSRILQGSDRRARIRCAGPVVRDQVGHQQIGHRSFQAGHQVVAGARRVAVGSARDRVVVSLRKTVTQSVSQL